MIRTRFCGINLINEITKEGDEKLYEFNEIIENYEVNISATAICEIRTIGNRVDITSKLLKSRDKTLDFTDTVQKVCATNDKCWILLKNGAIYCYDFLDSCLESVPFNGTIVDMTATHDSLIGLSNNNELYQFLDGTQIKIYDFQKHQRIKKIVSGDEHCLILTSNGDAFSFGCGLRGALGHGSVSSCDVPKQIEALAGLKIIDIAAGSFHSIALSSFGDVYSFGWNTNGQLGLPKVAQHNFKKAAQSHQQVFTVPQVIDLQDDEEAINAVFCGSKHTILRTEKNRLFAAGLNNYGQLGLSDHVEDVDKFTEIPVKDVNAGTTRIVCGYWSTYLLDKKEKPC